MPVSRTATKKAKSLAAIPAKTQRRGAKQTSGTISRRALQELSDRIDRDLNKLEADTERLAAEILR